jgi:hypothetical protein
MGTAGSDIAEDVDESFDLKGWIKLMSLLSVMIKSIFL